MFNVRVFAVAALCAACLAPAAQAADGMQAPAAPAPAPVEVPVVGQTPAVATPQAPAVPAPAPTAPSADIQPCPAPAKQPPAGSPPLYRCVQFVFHPINQPLIDATTYAYNLKTVWSQPSQDRWVPYDEQAVQDDFWNLWRLGFLDNLWSEVYDEPYENGVMGKKVVFHAEERPRVKIVDYIAEGKEDKLKVEISKIESTLRERNIEVRLDTFIDEASLRRVSGVIRELYTEQGYNDPRISTTQVELPGGPKLVHLTFRIDPGPKVRIRELVFDGNEAFPDSKLRKQLKDNKQRNFLSFISDAGIFKEAKFADDAERLSVFYKDQGYAGVQIGIPQTEVLETSPDGDERWIRVRVPVDEGPKYRIGTFELTGDSTLNLDAVKALFNIHEGEDYSNKKIREGLDKAREAYGTYGFWQWTFEPELAPRGIDPTTGKPLGPEEPEPIMDIRIRMNEGKQFYVNRIDVTGNTTTHDAVIRRELRVAEGGVFNTEALKESVRRLNQLGYFKELNAEQGAMDVSPTAGTDDKVDISLKVEEQNRNQISFGAGVSQFDGFFGQLSFQTSNFLGRGETVGVSLQRGSQASQYQLSFSEPYLFERPINVGVDIFRRQYIYPLQFTQRTSGGNAVVGFPLADYTRMFLTYSYEGVNVSDIDPAYLDPSLLASNLYLRDSLLIDQNGRRTVSKITPSVTFNTVNQPIFPSRGTRYTAAVDFAGIGGNTTYFQTRAEGIWYVPFNLRTSLGLRAGVQYILPYGGTRTLPIFEKLFSGGEFTVRGFDMRTIAPRDLPTGLVTGGNKMLTFNAEYYVNLFNQARLVFFYDAGQVRDVGFRFGWKEPVTTLVTPPRPVLTDVLFNPNIITAPGAIRTEVTGETSAFKTSTGVELRFFLPVLNVPFRLIGSYNPSRLGVINSNGEQTPQFTFRFAVGTTF